MLTMILLLNIIILYDSTVSKKFLANVFNQFVWFFN